MVNMFTLEEATSKLYDRTPEQLMNVAQNIKENSAWCAKHITNYEVIKSALEKVLEIRYTERKAIFDYYYGNQ